MKKHIKLFEEYVEEENDGHPGFLQSKDEIHEWLRTYDGNYKENKYQINEDWSVDVQCVPKDGKIWIIENAANYIKVKFNEVHGDFQCTLNLLKSLKGAPNKVYGNFDCAGNKLTTLEGAPNEVHGDFEVKSNNLTTLYGAPAIVHGNFDCSFNYGLKTLYGAPNEVHGYFDCYVNKLITLEHAPDIVKGTFECKNSRNLVTFGHKSKIKGRFEHDELLGSLGKRWKRYINYLDTLDEDDKKSSLQWLYDVDEDFHELIVRYAADNNIAIDAPGTDMDIASQASKHKDSGLF